MLPCAQTMSLFANSVLLSGLIDEHNHQGYKWYDGGAGVSV